jgi:hypothetical protein
MSSTGVPSMASRSSTVMVSPSTDKRRQTVEPIRLGRMRARWAKMPTSGPGETIARVAHGVDDLRVRELVEVEKDLDVQELVEPLERLGSEASGVEFDAGGEAAEDFVERLADGAVDGGDGSEGYWGGHGRIVQKR